ncbi:MAG: hypothetical protein M1829_005374 [Trizodia sp. TS-e1964]|nr:MAG: hypothetical protein M1829_005374 [Trizodia sp. TS-e1964]
MALQKIDRRNEQHDFIIDQNGREKAKVKYNSAMLRGVRGLKDLDWRPSKAGPALGPMLDSWEASAASPSSSQLYLIKSSDLIQLKHPSRILSINKGTYPSPPFDMSHQKEESDDSGICLKFEKFPIVTHNDEIRTPETARWGLIKNKYIVEKKHPIVKLWTEHLRQQVLELLLPHEEWKAMDVLRKGYSGSPEACPVTIQVTVDEGSSISTWNGVATGIKTLVNMYLDNIHVEIRAGRVYYSNGEPQTTLPYDVKPPLGSSIGIKDGNSSGTLGGYFCLLQRTGERVLVAVTCHHAVCSEGEVSIATFKNGVGLEDSKKIIINHPSEPDHKVTKSFWETEASNMRMKLLETQIKIDMGYDDNTTKNQPKNQKFADLFLERKNCTDETPRRFGVVLASSGCPSRPTSQCSMDWGLIIPDPERKGNNKFPPHERSPFVSILTAINGIAKLALEQVVYMWCRNSPGFQRGQFNSIVSDVKLPNNPSILSREWLILGNPRAFAYPGDSGAWVVDTTANLVGMVIGGSGEGGIASEETYITPIEDMIADIEQRLGVKVELPAVEEE